MITQTYNIDLVPNGKPLIVNVSQYDKLSRTLEFNVYSGGVLFEIPSGTAAVIQGTKLDGTGFSYNMTVSTSKVSMDIEQQMTVFDGDVHCEILFTKNAEQLGSANFILRVEKAAISDETIISETDIPIFRSFASGGSEGQVFVHGEGNEGAWRTVGTGSGVWGQITGTMSDQTDLQNALNGKQPTLTAGTNITIENNVISASGGIASVSWGNITGTLGAQSDLQNALDEKITAPVTGTVGQILSKTATGTEWTDAPNSAVWGGITGTLSNQTDLQNALNVKITDPTGGSTGQFLQKTSNGTQWANAGNVDTVNGISPDAQKNVQVDVELTKAQYDALPSSKLTDDINYYIKDGTNIPQAGVISASGVTYSNTSSGLEATTVQGAIDENASEIATVKNGLTDLTAVEVPISDVLTAASGITINSACCYKFGKLVNIKMLLSRASSTSHDSAIGTFKSGFVPTGNSYSIALGYATGADAGIAGMVTIGSGISIQHLPNKPYVVIDTTFLVAD